MKQSHRSDLSSLCPHSPLRCRFLVLKLWLWTVVELLLMMLLLMTFIYIYYLRVKCSPRTPHVMYLTSSCIKEEEMLQANTNAWVMNCTCVTFLCGWWSWTLYYAQLEKQSDWTSMWFELIKLNLPTVWTYFWSQPDRFSIRFLESDYNGWFNIKNKTFLCDWNLTLSVIVACVLFEGLFLSALKTELTAT